MATTRRGEALSLLPGMQVLDVGSGTGGPSRRFASLYGCRIVGIDLTQEYCDFAEFIAAKLGLDQLLAVEAVEGLVERGVLDGEVARRPLADRGGDPVAVPGARGERPQDEQVQGPLHERQRGRHRHTP